MINKHETIYQELTPEEIREQYGLQIDEDLEKYVKKINFQSKGRRIKIIYKKEGEKNGTQYSVETEYKLYTTKNCTNCNLAKSLINSQKLRIKILEAQEKELNYLMKNNIGKFPVLEIIAGEKSQFISGKDVGEFIASNLEKFK